MKTGVGSYTRIYGRVVAIKQGIPGEKGTKQTWRTEQKQGTHNNNKYNRYNIVICV